MSKPRKKPIHERITVPVGKQRKPVCPPSRPHTAKKYQRHPKHKKDEKI